jgi:hypothetical protein
LQAQSVEGIDALLTALVRGFDPNCDVVIEPYAPGRADTWPEPEPGGQPRRRRWRSAGHFIRVMVSWSPDRIAGPVLAQIMVKWLRERQAAGGAAANAVIAFYGPEGRLLDTMGGSPTAR